jgi:biopolymer transport protein ExbD
MRVIGLALASVLSFVIGCNEPSAKREPKEAPPSPEESALPKEPPKPTEPPDFQIFAEGPKIGWTNILLEKEDGPKKLRAEIAEHAEHVKGQTVSLSIDRKARLPWVVEMLTALDEAGARGFDITTQTRPEFEKSIQLAPLSSVKSPPGCTVVAKVLAERRNAVWQLSGGTAVRSPKGLAGPDMAMTAANLERAGRACKESQTLLVSADEDVEWGLVYDLAAASKTVEKVTFEPVVLLAESPTAGRPVVLP